MRSLSKFYPDFSIIGLLFLLPLLMFFQQTVGGRTLLPTENLYQYEPYATYREVVSAPDVPHNHLVSDLILQNYQWKSYLRDSIDRREVPLWNPHQFSGIPFMAAGQQSTLYPLSLLYYVLPLTAAYGWFTVLNLWLAGVFTYLFLRGLGISRTGATIGGITYQLCGFLVASAVFPMIIGAAVWLPLMLLMAEFIIRRQPLFERETSVPWVAVGAMALGCNILAGHPEITIYSLMILAYFAAIRLVWRAITPHNEEATPKDKSKTPPLNPMERGLVKSAGWLAVMVALGLALGAIQLIPLYEFVNTNWRAERDSLDLVLSYAHSARDILQYTLPNFYGNPAHHEYFDIFSMETVPVTINALGETITHTEWGLKNYVEGALYVGILPLILAGYGLIDGWWLGRKRLSPPYRLAFALLALVSLTFMFGLPNYGLIYPLPGINQLNTPFRWVFGVTISIAILAGFGADALTRSPRAVRRTGFALCAAGVLILVGLLMARVTYAQIEPLIEDYVIGTVDPETGTVTGGMALAAGRFADARMFFSYQFPQVLALGLLVMASGVVFWLAGHRRGLWHLLAVAVVAVDLLIATGGFNPASDPALLDFTPPVIEWMQEQDGRYTVIDNPPIHDNLLNANMTLRYGLDDIRGYDSIIPLQYVDYMRRTAPQPQLDFNRIAPLYLDDVVNVNWRRLDLLNVRHIVTHKATSIPDDLTAPTQAQRTPRLSLVYEDEATKVYLNNRAMPRVYVTGPEPTIEQFTRIGDATITQDTGREKLVNVQIDGPGWLIVSETYRSGWRAFVRPLDGSEDDEESADLVRVMENFQAVPLPAGDFIVRLVYSPTEFQVGVFGTVIGVALLMFIMGVWFWRLMLGSGDDKTGVSRVARNSIAPIILNLFNRGIDFAFAFVMLRILGPEQAGIYYYAIVVFVWFDIFTNFGLDVFLIREASRHKDRAGHLFSNTTMLRLVLMLACVPLLLGFLLIRQAAVEPALTSEALVAIGLLYIGLAPGSISKGITSIFYAFEKAEIPAAVTTITTVNKAVFGLSALLLGYGIVGLAGVSIITNFITLAILMWAGQGLYQGAKRIDMPLVRGMVRESWPLMLNHFLATIFFQIDIVILEAMRGAVIIGKYSVAYRWLLAIGIIPAFFTQALLPVMSRQADENRDALKRTYTLGVKLLVSLAVPLAVAFTFLADPLTLFLGGREFMPEGAVALQIMIWSIPIGWINSLTQYALIAVDLQRHITRAFAVAVTFNIVSNVLLIPLFGFRAAAVTTILSELVLLIPFGLLMQRALGRIPWLEMVTRPLAAGAVMAIVFVLMWDTQPLVALFAGSVIYGGVLLGLRPLNATERDMLLPLLPGRLRRLANWPYG